MTTRRLSVVSGRIAMLAAMTFVAVGDGARALADDLSITCTAQSPGTQVRFSLGFSPADMVIESVGDFHRVNLAGFDHLRQAGQPRLPVRAVGIALPEGLKVNSVRVQAEEWRQIPGLHLIEPATPPEPKSVGYERPDYVAPDRSVYDLDTAWPSLCVEFLGQSDLAGQSIAIIRINPVRYVPADGTLSLATRLDVVLDCESGYVCGDYLPPNVSDRARMVYEKMIRGMVDNPGDVALRHGPGGPLGGWGVEPGEFEYVIVTQSAWVDDFQPLADWRIACGIRSTIVTTDWIYNGGGYTGTTLEKVQAFVMDAHNTWGATHFLMGGDTNVIPYHIRTIEIPGYWTDDVPNDAYFADFDEDWICEVHIGRASVRSADAVATFIDKVLTYERTPPPSDYVTTAFFMGFDISYCGDGDGEAAKENMRSLHLPADWAVNTEYDAEPGTHKDDVIDYLNQGHHLVNHHDHCNTDVMGSGWICHNELLTMADVDALHNGNRLSILFAVGCWPCNIPAYECIGEAAIHNPGGGCVAFMGNSRTGWGGPPDDPDHYTSQQDRFFYRNLFDDGFVTLGENFSDMKNDEYSDDDPYNLHKYCFTQLYLLGDPEMPVWSEEPRTLDVGHDDTVPRGEPVILQVSVDCDGEPVDNATVCAWKGDEVYEVGQTVGGVAELEFTAGTAGPMLVTVIGRNYLPYEGEIQVVEGAPCPGDVNGDETADIDDVFAVLAAWGPCNQCPEDVNDDGTVDIDDLFDVLGNWGPCP